MSRGDRERDKRRGEKKEEENITGKCDMLFHHACNTYFPI